MAPTEAPAPETVYIRFLASGLTVQGSGVTRRGFVLEVPPEHPDYAVLSLDEKGQRALWHRPAFYELLTREEYAEAVLARDGIAPELAARPVTPPPPGADPAIERGGGSQPAMSTPTVTPPVGGEAPPPPAADPEAKRWPWYPTADIPTVIGYVANMPEGEAVEFLAYEVANKNRKGVTGPMTGS